MSCPWLESQRLLRPTNQRPPLDLRPHLHQETSLRPQVAKEEITQTKFIVKMLLTEIDNQRKTMQVLGESHV